MRSKLAVSSLVLSLIPILGAIWFMVSVAGPTTVIDGDGVATTVNLLDGPNGFGGALILSLVYSLLITFWIGILAIIFGIVALVKIKKYDLEGKWLAISGIIVSLLPVVIWIVYLLLNLGT